MPWKQKDAPISKGVQMIELYLSIAMAPFREQQLVPAAKAAVQVFILGMVDKLRQVETLTWERSIAIYHDVLAQHSLLPSVPVNEFINCVEQAVASNRDIESVLRQGAQSITMYVSEHDADAPIDLLNVTNFAEMHVSSFTGLSGAA